MRVRDVMRKEVRTIKPTETTSAAKELFRRYDIRHLVVVNNKDVVGVLADRDLIDVDANTAVQRAMAHPPVTIASDETVRKAAALMTGHVIGSLSVVDDGKLVGIVTTSDLLALLAKGATRPAPSRGRVVMAKRAQRRTQAGTSECSRCSLRNSAVRGSWPVRREPTDCRCAVLAPISRLMGSATTLRRLANATEEAPENQNEGT